MGAASISIHLLIGAALGCATEAGAARDLPSVLAEIDQGFTCPEFQPDDAARKAEITSFSRALASVGPARISYRKAAYIRARMLERHNCTRGTFAIAASAPPTDTAAPGAPN